MLEHSKSKSKKKGYLSRHHERERVNQLNRALHEKVDELQAILDIIPIGLAIADDKECSKIRGNKSFIKLLKLSPEEVEKLRNAPTKERLDLFPMFKDGKKLSQSERPLFAAALKKKEVFNEEIDLVSQSKGTIHLLANAAPLLNDKGDTRGAIAAYWDITEMKKAQEDLHLAKIRAEEANETKNQFLTKMSHDLKTPLTSILGMADLIAEETISSQVRDYLTTLKSSAHILFELINEILDYTQIKSGRVQIKEDPFYVESTLREICSILEIKAKEKGLNFSLDISQDVPKILVGDPVRLKQVIMNLGSNAVKYTLTGNVSIEVGVSNRDKDDLELLVKIKDTGIGIKKSDLKNIYQPFNQLQANTEGTGLGLAIARAIVELMGGEISVISKEGEGSIFSFNSRFGIYHSISEAEEEERTQAARLPEAPAKSLKILLAEDTLANQKLISTLLKRRGHSKVDIAENGEEATRKVKTHDYDVILMDVSMPVMDGYEATKKLKDYWSREGKKEIPIIAITAHTTQHDIEKCNKVGMSGYLQKPINKIKLFSLLENTMGDGPTVFIPLKKMPNIEEEFQTWSLDKALELTDGDKELLGEMIDLFLDYTPKRLKTMAEALVINDLGTIALEAHAMKAMAGNFGARPAQEAAIMVEGFAQRKEEQSLKSGFVHLKTATKKLMSELEKYKSERVM